MLFAIVPLGSRFSGTQTCIAPPPLLPSFPLFVFLCVLWPGFQRLMGLT